MPLSDEKIVKLFDDEESLDARYRTVSGQNVGDALFYSRAGEQVVWNIAERMQMQHVGFCEQSFGMFQNSKGSIELKIIGDRIADVGNPDDFKRRTKSVLAVT